MPSAAHSLEKLVEAIPPFFQEAQHSLANHRKNAVALHRIHAQCSQVTEETPRGLKLIGEKAFNTSFIACINRVLLLKKGVTQADRCLKFVSSYAIYSQVQFRKEDPDADEEGDTSATRFVTIMIKHIIKGLRAKNKNVRLRACQLVALLVSGLESMDDDLYQSLLRGLLERTRDKEASVRVQAVVALAKLQSGDEDEDENTEDQEYYDDEDDEDADGDNTLTYNPNSKSIRKHLLDVLRLDSSPEVRRAALFNIPINASTLPAVLERLRDTDAINRRCVYLGSLSAALAQPGSTQLTPDEAHQIVHTGLGEREESVQKACTKLIATWVDRDGGDSLRLIDRFDGLTYPDSTTQAIRTAFDARPALIDSVILDDAFWNDLTPNTALLARTSVGYLKTKGRVAEARLEELMPLVMALAFRIQSVWSSLVQTMTNQQETETEELEAVALSQTSVLDSLLRIALISDYGDEIGRRKMFALLREMISHPSLPKVLIETCTDVLMKLSAGQRDFVRIVVEIVQELADEEDEEQPGLEDEDNDDAAEVEDLIQTRRERTASGESQGSKNSRKAESDSRRLLLVKAMLERMASNLHENTAIHGLIPQLIAPAVKSKNAHVREHGLVCLGLCCLLDSALALDTFPLFLDQIQRGGGEIKLRATQIVFDQLLVHGIPYLSSRQAQAAGGGPDAAAMAYSQIVGFLLSLLEDDEESVQAAAAEGMAKLMLSGMVEDDEALRSLVLVYMSPETTSNQEMRQCLNYFLPVYCLSSSTNQRRLQRVVVPTIQVLTEVYHEVKGEQEMVTPAQVGAQLLDWSDPTKAVSLAVATDRCIHFDIGLELLQTLLTSEIPEERKVMVLLLNKLVLPEEADIDSARGKTLFLLAAKLKEANPIEEPALRNAFSKFESSCAQRYPQHVAAAQSTDTSIDEDLEKLRGFLESCDLSVTINIDDIAAVPDVNEKRIPARGKKATTSTREKRLPSTTAQSDTGSRRLSTTSSVDTSRRTVSMTSTRSASTSQTDMSTVSVDEADVEEDDIEEEEERDDEDDTTTIGAGSDDELAL